MAERPRRDNRKRPAFLNDYSLAESPKAKSMSSRKKHEKSTALAVDVTVDIDQVDVAGPSNPPGSKNRQKKSVSFQNRNNFPRLSCQQGQSSTNI